MAVSFHQRSTGIEIMDDLACHGEVVDQTLRELDFINHWLGGNAVTLSALKLVLKKSSSDTALTIADLGCGSGEMLRIIAKKTKGKNLKMNLLGFDANTNITHYAREQTRDFNNIHFFADNVFDQPFRAKQFDIVLATLFMHHFSSDELAALLSQLKTQAGHAIIINDLHRHPLAYYSIKWLTQLFSKSAMVKFDAPLSVLRAFTKQEWQCILAKAQINNYRLTWKWAFRWQLIIYT